MAIPLVDPPFSRSSPGELPELMDRPDCDPLALREALDAIDRAGRASGRDRILRRHVVAVLRGRAPGSLSVLDIGAGGGHASLRLARRLGVVGWRPRLTLADLHAGALRIAAESIEAGSAGRGTRRPAERRIPIGLVRLSGPELPFRDASFDLVLSTNTLHHLTDRDAVRMLAQMARVARHGLVVVDLRRSRAAYAGTRLLAETVWRHNPFPRHDGPRSVRRAFTPAEAADLLVDAGLEGAVVTAHLFWIGLRWWRGAEVRAGATLERPAWLRPEMAVGPAGSGA